MAHESFEDEATAELLNTSFVCVKVDREERPDVDAVYMAATQAMTGQGGWPMSVVLTPDREPFFAGTYFPVEPRHGMPAFRQVLEAVSQAWRERREDVREVARDVVGHLRALQQTPGSAAPEVDLEEVGASAVHRLAEQYDARFAGFGGAPKFPPSMVCEFLLRRAARTGDEEALAMAASTLTAMARGGIYDQLGGGFARYSVDAQWQVPHFEKMLYDNALLLSAYAHWWRLTRSDLAERVVRGTAAFLLGELRTPEGGFASSLDADSDGREGGFYVWTPAELRDVLGDAEGEAAARALGVTESGNVDGGGSTLQLVDVPDEDRLGGWLADLQAARERRPRPSRDDKVVAAWNGLAIGALAEAAVLFGEPRWLEAATASARLLTSLHLDADGLRRVSRDGTAGAPLGVLEDYACLAEGLLTLFAATGDTAWYDESQRLVDGVRGRFSDRDGGYFDTDAAADHLVVRPRDPTDNATPSGAATMAAVLVTLHGLTGDESYRKEAYDVMAGPMRRLARDAPRFAGKALSVAESMADGPRQVAVVGSRGEAGRDALVRAAFASPRPGLVIAQGEPGSHDVPLLRDRGLIHGAAAAYVCHHFVCDLPVTDPALLVVR